MQHLKGLNMMKNHTNRGHEIDNRNYSTRNLGIKTEVFVLWKHGVVAKMVYAAD